MAIQAFHRRMRKERPPFAFLATDVNLEDDGHPKVMDCYDLKNRAELIVFLSREVNFTFYLLTVCIDGKPLSVDEVNKIQTCGLKAMAPISRAIAEGRWPHDILEERGMAHVSGY